MKNRQYWRTWARAICLIGCLLVKNGSYVTFAQDMANIEPLSPPAPPSQVVAKDAPNDTGTSLVVMWVLSPDDRDEFLPRRVIGYDILRKTSESGEYVSVGEQTYQKNRFTDTKCERGKAYWYQVVAIGPSGERSEGVATPTPTGPEPQWIDGSRLWFGFELSIVCAAVLYYIGRANKGDHFTIRHIPGLDAVDEAVGRATEMGRPCLFVPGIQDINDIQTVAGVTILSRVAGLTAQYDAPLEVPTSRSLVMTTARETVQASYLAAGRPDAYREDNIYYLTDEQFGYVAGVTGSMMREKPAACFYFGAFYAESLILAETGNSIGAIQVAGTAESSQLPFFVAACDYTLIGEEFFAASAYLSKQPAQLGSLKGQDFGKLCGAGLIAIGCLLATTISISEFPMIKTALDYLKNNVLGDGGLLP
ncbi:MAG: hypothetical protein O2955_12775 [Planctomycetota bacterium]|nr:hypothetical protein [Planctomycetota bacterium]MDA1213382.1 hypothetical protein [Planctomycetota bacterium]